MNRKASAGLTFTHQRWLDQDWVPGPGQKYTDAPKAVCSVTAVREGRVYYTLGADTTRGRWVASEPDFWQNIVGEVLS